MAAPELARACPGTRPHCRSIALGGRAPRHTRSLSAAAPPPVAGAPAAAAEPAWLVRRLNAAFAEHPYCSGAVILGGEALSFFACKALIVASGARHCRGGGERAARGLPRSAGVEVSALFALAFALARPLRHWRRVADIGAAVALARAVPAIGRVDVRPLLGALRVCVQA